MVIQNLNAYLRQPQTQKMIVQIGFNSRLEIVTVAVVVRLPSKSHMFLVITSQSLCVKTFYITDMYKSKQRYNVKNTGTTLVENLYLQDCKEKFLSKSE